MQYEFLAGNLALDFANTVHSRGRGYPGDDLKAPADLVEWAVQAGLVRLPGMRQLRKTPVEEARFRRAIALREVLYEIFSRAAKGKKPRRDSLQAFQSLYQNAIRHAEFRPLGNHYELAGPATNDPLVRALQEITRSAATLLTSEALTRVRQCSGEACSWLFVDSSRNGLRRWCDMKACGNRAKVWRFRRRKHARVKSSNAIGQP